MFGDRNVHGLAGTFPIRFRFNGRVHAGRHRRSTTGTERRRDPHRLGAGDRRKNRRPGTQPQGAERECRFPRRDGLHRKCRQAQASRVPSGCAVLHAFPCDMCSGMVLLYKIPRVVIGENRTFQGPEEYLRSRGVELVVLDDEECVRMMTDFIAADPELWDEDIGGE